MMPALVLQPVTLPPPAFVVAYWKVIDVFALHVALKCRLDATFAFDLVPAAEVEAEEAGFGRPTLLQLRAVVRVVQNWLSSFRERC